MEKLTLEDLKKVSGGFGTEIDVTDIIKQETGMTPAQLLTFFGNLLTCARNDGKNAAANALENVLKSGKINLMNYAALVSALADLRKVAENHGLKSELELLNKIPF